MWIVCPASSLRIHKHKNFLTVVAHVIIIDLWNQSARLYEIQVIIIYIAALFLSLTPERRVKRVICKTWTETLANSAGKQCEYALFANIEGVKD